MSWKITNVTINEKNQVKFEYMVGESNLKLDTIKPHPRNKITDPYILRYLEINEIDRTIIVVMPFTAGGNIPSNKLQPVVFNLSEFNPEDSIILMVDERIKQSIIKVKHEIEL